MVSGAQGDDRLGIEVRPSDMLRIDVAAELRNLSQGQLQGSWQVPAELVREALRRGAGAVSLRLARRAFELAADGARIGVDEIEQLRVVLDSSAPSAAQHGAVLALESAGAHALLWLAGLDQARLRIESATDRGLVRLDRRQGRAPVVELDRRSLSPRGLVVAVGASRLDAAEAARWLHAACRFAPVPITVNGRRVAASVHGGLFRLELRSPLPGQMWIAASGDAPRLWLLQHGVLAARAMVPGYPAFEAAVELGQVVRGPASPAALREAVTPFLPGLIDQATVMLLRLGERLPELAEPSRQRISALLLRSLCKGLRREEIERVPLVRIVTRIDGDGRWVPLAELPRLTRGGTLWALVPGQDPGAHVLPAVGAAVLSTEERDLIGEVLGLHFEQPPGGRRRPSLRSWLVAVRGALPRAVSTIVSRLRRWRPLDEAELEPAERALAAELRRVLAGTDALEVAICSGGGAVRHARGRRPRLLLPRGNRLVQSCARAVERDREWLYPALLALLDCQVAPPERLRSRWVRSRLLVVGADSP